MSKKSNPPGSFDVGYKKPPSQTRFQKGISGNPKGRPKGSQNLTTLIDKVFSRKIVAQDNGRARRITVAEAMLTKIMSKAIQGDAAAQRISIALLQLGKGESAPPPSLFESEDDWALLKSALNDHIGAPAPAKRKAKPNPKKGGTL